MNVGAILYANQINKDKYNISTLVKGNDLFLNFETHNEACHFLEKNEHLPLIARLPYADNPEYELHWVPSHYSDMHINNILAQHNIDNPKNIIFIPYQKHKKKRVFQYERLSIGLDTSSITHIKFSNGAINLLRAKNEEENKKILEEQEDKVNIIILL